MCECKGLRGPQGPIGVTGATGATGATGPTGPIGPSVRFTKVTIGSTSIPSSTDIPIIASAASSGSLTFFGQFQFDTLASVSDITVTIDTLINGVPSGSSTISFISIIGVTVFTVPVSDLLAITSGQSFAIRVTLDDYAQSTTIIGRIMYYIS